LPYCLIALLSSVIFKNFVANFVDFVAHLAVTKPENNFKTEALILASVISVPL